VSVAHDTRSDGSGCVVALPRATATGDWRRLLEQKRRRQLRGRSAKNGSCGGAPGASESRSSACSSTAISASAAAAVGVSGSGGSGVPTPLAPASSMRWNACAKSRWNSALSAA
jgi:hypothetical protein